jgi:putative glycosyltransferase
MNVKISVITTLYKSERFISVFLDEVLETMREINQEYELILVLDGITDEAMSILLKRKAEFKNIKIIEFSRNFGHHYALMAGMKNSEGDYVMIIDCDLEVRPSIISRFYNVIEEKKCDVVFGYQSLRKGNFIERVFGGAFWKVLNLLSEIKIQENVATERIMTRQYINELVALNDKNLFLAGMMDWVGFEQYGIELKKGIREGKSSYTLRKRVKLMVNAITSFSAYPLNLLFVLGSIITLFSFLFGLYFFVKKILFPELIQEGFTSLITTIMFSTGMIVMSLGILGKYIEKIFNQVKDRPLYVIKRIIR